ncbi:uncharacterized protein EDB91DRAFT_1166572 [Suillus paluster]|uniref:uncharacterized protein n=1 Tax=Suillus paluster TaxID=48578 RepID=UPI001B861254|nr:uncharacterized protein EDB91DRAFT_1166572 [Suillus paluster]KAG1726175.1 hypothetical protein EDB91DRAFT_1166572 [Suillus paluster]
MRFSFVLAAVAALIVSISASDADSENCPCYCRNDRDCQICINQYGCVSMNSLRPGFKHMTHQRGSSFESLYATPYRRLAW